MTVDFTEYLTKLQAQSIEALKQAQEANVASLTSLRDVAAGLPTFQTPVESLPSAKQVIEMSFGFANQVLELRKAYALQLAEMVASAQKATAETTARAAKAATSHT